MELVKEYQNRFLLAYLVETKCSSAAHEFFVYLQVSQAMEPTMNGKCVLERMFYPLVVPILPLNIESTCSITIFCYCQPVVTVRVECEVDERVVTSRSRLSATYVISRQRSRRVTSVTLRASTRL